MKEPRIPVAPDNAPVGFGWQLMAKNADSMGWTEYAIKCRDMAERSRLAGRDVSAIEQNATDKKERQLTLW
jgi:hypothetical protein